MPTPPLPPFFRDTTTDLIRVAALLRAGELVALPTETVYGLAANALDETAVRRIFTVKGRPLIDPLIVHVPTLEAVAQIATPPPRLRRLATQFWPGPLTVVLRKKRIIPDLVTAGTPTVAIRIPRHPLMQKVLSLTGLFLAAPSANPFGYISPTRPGHVRDSLGEKTPWILDGGECAHGIESTILDLTNPATPRLLRTGPVTRDALESALNQPVAPPPKTPPGQGGHPEQPTAQPAPGMLTRHYSPRTPIVLRNHGAAIPVSPPSPLQRRAIVWLQRPDKPSTDGLDFWLSETGSPEEIGRNIFALLRQLDSGQFDVMHVELTNGTGLGAAINDRLTRAAAKP
ncbi:MAG: threonylcarbamoyl-AMP synthase [Puniceicoccales bacterium]|jgi:L-threonylcarbamoyladenylate synthase|nr:threonylcarbamoyl-AMP synthase [Puniceicoccales bacterium]